MAKNKGKKVISGQIDLLWLGAAVVVLAAFFVLYSGMTAQSSKTNPEVQGVSTVNDSLRQDFKSLENSLNEL